MLQVFYLDILQHFIEMLHFVCSQIGVTDVMWADLHAEGDGETAAKPETTVQDNLSTSVSVKPLDTFPTRHLDIFTK